MTRLAALTLVLAGPVLAQAGGTADLARLLPPETIVYIDAQTPSAEEIKTQAAYRCFNEPAFKRVLKRLMTDENTITSMTIPLGAASLSIQTDLSNPVPGLNIKYVDGKGARRLRLQQRFTGAWVGLRQADGAGGASIRSFPADLVFAVEVENPKEAVVTLERIVAASWLVFQKQSQSIDAQVAAIFSDTTHRGITYARGAIMGFSFFFVPIGRLVALASSEARAQDMIDRHLDGTKASLATDPRHRAILASAAGDGTATTLMVIHVDRALDKLQASFGGPILYVRNQLARVGLGGLKSVTSVARVEGNGISSITSVLIEGDRVGLARLFEDGKPARMGILEYAPKDSLYVTCGNFDAGALYQIALEVGGMEVARGGLEFEKMFGVRLREDLLDRMGPEAGLIVAPSRGLLPDLALVIESKEPNKLNEALLHSVQRAPWPAGLGVHKVKIGGVDAYVAPLGHRKLADFPIAPTWGVVDGRLVVTPFPLSFQHIVAVKRGERSDVTKNRGFASMRARIPEDALGMSYLDFPRVLAIGYDTLLPLLQSMPPEGSFSHFYDLPDVGILARHLYPRVGWRVADERGMHWLSHGPMDMSGLMIGTASAAAGLAVFLGAGHEAQGPQTMKTFDPPVRPRPDMEARLCGNRVRKLSARLRFYEKQHGRLPTDIDRLKAKHIAPETFLVPGTGRPYVYLGPTGKGGILLHGHPNGKDRRICVLTRRMELMRVTEAELQRRLRLGEGGR